MTTSRGGPRTAGVPGEALLIELRDSAGVDELAATLRAFPPGLDRSSEVLHERTGGRLDLADARHREALLAWLRAWGCRHLRVADTPMSSEALLAWWGAHAGRLPGRRTPLVSLSARQLDRAAAAYETLAGTIAARRAHRGGEVGVTFGETAASKTLFALRPAAFPPWDVPMRLAFGPRTTGADGFRRYLELSAEALHGMSRRVGVPVAELPRLLGRPASTPARLVDEYLWVRVDRAR